MDSCLLNTPLGTARIEGDDNGIQSISVHSEYKPDQNIPNSLKACAEQLNEYFEGSRRNFELKLNPQGTSFQKKVWNLLSEIPYGQTISYLELSHKLGDAKAIRAVAAANGKNPLWIISPCHRVIGSDGSLIGYAGGLTRKKWLLNHENSCKQMSLFE